MNKVALFCSLLLLCKTSFGMKPKPPTIVLSHTANDFNSLPLLEGRINGGLPGPWISRGILEGDTNNDHYFSMCIDSKTKRAIVYQGEKIVAHSTVQEDYADLIKHIKVPVVENREMFLETQ